MHLAALAGVRPSLERPAAYADVNVHGTAAVLRRPRCAPSVPQLVFASSSSVYGEREGGPFRETDPVERPISPYAATKRAGELLAHRASTTRTASAITCARIFTAYGPRQRPDLAIRKFAEKHAARRADARLRRRLGACATSRSSRIWSTGWCARSTRDLGFAILNFGAGRTVSVHRGGRDARAGARRQGARSSGCRAQTGDVSRTWADTSAARAALGYAPAVALEEGIARFVDWLREAGRA